MFDQFVTSLLNTIYSDVNRMIFSGMLDEESDVCSRLCILLQSVQNKSCSRSLMMSHQSNQSPTHPKSSFQLLVFIHTYDVHCYPKFAARGNFHSQVWHGLPAKWIRHLQIMFNRFHQTYRNVIKAKQQ